MKKLILICLILALPKTSFANERSIPLELFTAKKSQYGGQIKITGPKEWKNKRTGEVVQVYERKRGSKIQSFAKTNNGQCLGRVMDTRYEKKCLTFRWSKAKLDGHIVDDNSYTYCPKKGFTKMVSHKTNTFKMKVSGDIKGTGTK